MLSVALASRSLSTWKPSDPWPNNYIHQKQDKCKEHLLPSIGSSSSRLNIIKSRNTVRPSFLLTGAWVCSAVRVRPSCLTLDSAYANVSTPNPIASDKPAPYKTSIIEIRIRHGLNVKF